MNDKDLAGLFGSDSVTASRAWQKFLRKYSRLILKIIWQFDNDYDKVMDKYLYVCGKLSADNFAILKKFDPTRTDNAPKFSTWLFVVVRNLCVESHREEHGRRRLPRAIAKMEPFERKVFELHYWKGHTVDEIVNILAGEESGASQRLQESIPDTLGRIETRLTRPARLAQSRRRRIQTISYDDEKLLSRDQDLSELAEWIEEAMRTLPARERAVVRLRFWEDMTAKEIGGLLGIRPVRKVYTMLDKTLERLRGYMKEDNLRKR